jgi:lysozyme family protein
MTARFVTCLNIVLGNEGGISNHKADRGGLTNSGVTQRTYDMYRAKHGLIRRPVTEMTPPEVEAIYDEYWKDARCAYLPEPVDLLVFDTAINSGARRAMILLQRALGVPDDGLFGKVTMDALHEEMVAGDIKQICKAFLDAREDFFYDIVDRDATQQAFIGGWINRLDGLRERVGVE